MVCKGSGAYSYLTWVAVLLYRNLEFRFWWFSGVARPPGFLRIVRRQRKTDSRRWTRQRSGRVPGFGSSRHGTDDAERHFEAIGSGRRRGYENWQPYGVVVAFYAGTILWWKWIRPETEDARDRSDGADFEYGAVSVSGRKRTGNGTARIRSRQARDDDRTFERRRL